MPLTNTEIEEIIRDARKYVINNDLETPIDYYISGATEATIKEREKAKVLLHALEDIAGSDGECCQRCEGNGNLWADGQAHYPSYDGPTVNCGHCGGEGRLYPDLKEIASEAINQYKQ